MGREGVRTHPCGMDVLQGVHFSVVSRRVALRRVASCRVASRCVALRCVASRCVALRRVALRRVRRCSLREPPAAKHGSTSLRLSGRAGGFRWVFFFVPFCPVLPCRVALRPVLSRRVALRCVRRCSLWEPPAVKHGSTSLRLSGRTEGASGGCSSPFCLVLPCRVALRPVLSRRVVSAGVPFGSHLRLSMVQPL